MVADLICLGAEELFCDGIFRVAGDRFCFEMGVYARVFLKNARYLLSVHEYESFRIVTCCLFSFLHSYGYSCCYKVLIYLFVQLVFLLGISFTVASLSIEREQSVVIEIGLGVHQF